MSVLTDVFILLNNAKRVATYGHVALADLLSWCGWNEQDVCSETVHLPSTFDAIPNVSN